jgi:hypothetical protein
MIRRSPQRGTFSMERYEKNLIDDPTDESSKNMIDFYKTHTQMKLELEETDEWRIDNMEYDLRTSELIIEKCKDRIYAQHLYAAMCNNEFTKNDVWPILSDKRWSCSWRSSGGIIADIRQEGDYIDWYCSGIRNNEDLTDEEYNQLSREEQEIYLESKARVSESVVTDEIRRDLLAIGWIVVDSELQDY